MKTQADRKFSYLPMLIAGIAVVLFSTAAIARMLGWGLSSTGESGDIPALEVSATSKLGARPNCPECGMIVSMRELEKHDEDPGPGAAGAMTAGTGDKTRVISPRSYEITVRMADGSSRLFNAENPARWRAGERLIVIAGTDPPLP